MKKTIIGMTLCAVCAASCLAAVEKTMTVPRCQAMLKDGTQCMSQVDPGKTYCWRHRGAAKAVKESMDDAGKGASKAWNSTKEWSTNAWHSTREAFEEFGDEFTKMMRKNFKKDPKATKGGTDKDEKSDKGTKEKKSE